MPYRKILVTDAIKKKLISRYSETEGIERGDFSAQVIEQGLSDLEQTTPPPVDLPDDEPRTIPRAGGGNKRVEFSLDRHKALDRRLKEFRRRFKYDKDTTAYRACLYQGLGILPSDW